MGLNQPSVPRSPLNRPAISLMSTIRPSLERLDFDRCTRDDRVMGVITFSAVPQALTLPSNSLPAAVINMPLLMGTDEVMEVWRSERPARFSKTRDIRYAENGELLFGVMEVDATTIEEATYRAYQNFITMTRDAGYPHILRVWNHFPRINDKQGELELYQRFCMGRYRAYEESGHTAASDFPAASALGTEGGTLCIYFIAARQPGNLIENPRQVSAYRYPPAYGPRSPSFSRAVRRGDQIFISGTASIVGHATVHESQAIRQCTETLANLQALLLETHPERDFPPPSAAWRVYLRSTNDFHAIQDCILSALGRESDVLFLKGDICRADLLVEIEGVINDLESAPVQV